jgi:putative 235 kDa rhoptry protein
LLDFNYDEIELISKILNFKIVNKKDAFENKIITEKNFSEKLKTVNNMLNAEKLGQIVETKEYLFFFGKYDKKVLKWKEVFKFLNSMRKEMIYLFLLISSKKFNIMRFGQKIWESNENRTTLKSDLRSVLNGLDIDYKKYMSADEPAELIKLKINKFEKVRQEYVKNILLKRWERVYNGIASKPEIIEMEMFQEELGIKNLYYIYEVLEEFFNKYGRMNSKGERYDFFTYLLLNLKNEKINCRKRVTSLGVKLKEEENFRLLDEMLGKISETEDIKIYSYFKFKLYKYLLKKEKTNNEISYENYETEDYKIAEVFLGENIEEYQEEKEVYWNNEKSEKLRVVMVYDLENTEISKNIENLRKISEFMNITGVYRFDDFKKEYSDLSDIAKGDYFDYILIVSNGEIQNTVINYSEKPISFLKLNDKESNGKKKSRFKKNAEFYNNLKIMDNMMKEYEKMFNKKYN